MPEPGLAPFTGVFRANDDHRVKRSRPSASCTACQRRKSRCDRRQPCGACEKRGGDSSCQFGGNAGRKEVQMRLSRLEEMVQGLADARRRQQKTSPDNDAEARGVPAVGGQELHGDGIGDDYHGVTSWTALVDSIRDIQTLLSTVGEEPDTSEPKPAGEEPDLVFGDVNPVTVADAVASLPARQEADRLVSLYFNAKFIAVPFLHAHHFRRCYESFWADPSSAGFLWTSILFSVLSAGVMVARVRDPAQATPPSVTEPRVYLVRAAQCLVAGQYLRARPWSVEAVLLYAHCRNVQGPDADSALWPVYGLAVRLAQRRGYHRDAGRIGLAVSPFEAEMRRRTWFTVQSTDLLLSLQHGLPSLVDQDVCDAGHPTNLTDDDFDEPTSPLPPPRAPTDPTPILACTVKSRLCRILRRVARLALSPSPVPYVQTQALHSALEQWHADLPACLRVRPIRTTAFTDPSYTVMHRLMLEVMYLKTLCVLHRPYLTTVNIAAAPDADPRHRASGQVCRDAARRLLELHVEVDAETRPGRRMYEDRYMMTSMTYDHFLLAAMVLCLDLSESTDYSCEDRASRIRLLRTIHDLWYARRAASLDARHASRVLRAILARVDPAPAIPSSPSAAPPPQPQPQPPSRPGPVDDAGGGDCAVGLGEMPSLESFLGGSVGVDWLSVDQFLRPGPSPP
ncbi:fungal specific transcription factor [Hirsutella rhossiliensis]|uniref:Fungal specific transcription factor domain-containing protein n=1 Tax=Hirsutella rhossiliensis TaxID=111463 RepID=A0A9P8N348_9HYPO|nr:fungal specific transcription factor domain-containing protein [Hirsutella rhossiliensis]KAH0963837.1 fungal specific transcription factor domain-containing protein [Hirsutella rhossiliensis]